MANKGFDRNGSQFFIVTADSTDTSKIELCNELAAKAEKVSEEKIKMYQEKGGAMWLDAQIGTLYEKGGKDAWFQMMMGAEDIADLLTRAEYGSSCSHTGCHGQSEHFPVSSSF